MWIIVGCYLLIFVSVTVCIVLTVRAGRGADAPSAASPPETHPLIPEEWDAVRREHCLPSGCQRVTGSPPGPRKDAECAACASEFLELRWDRLLGEPPREGRTQTFALPVFGASGSSAGREGELITQITLPEPALAPLQGPRPRPGSIARFGRYILAFGTFLVLAGVAVLAITVARPFVNEDWPWVVLSWGLVFAGAVLVILAWCGGTEG